MSVGPIHFAGTVMGRSIGPMIYANPFNGGLVSWIGDSSNSWDTVSYVLVVIILCSATWLANSAMTFFERRSKTAIMSCCVLAALLVVLVQGDKFDPLDWRQTTAAILFSLAYLSSCGRLFAMTEGEKK